MSVEEEFEKYWNDPLCAEPLHMKATAKAAYLAGREQGYAEGRSDERKACVAVVKNVPASAIGFRKDVIEAIERQEGGN